MSCNVQELKEDTHVSGIHCHNLCEWNSISVVQYYLSLSLYIYIYIYIFIHIIAVVQYEHTLRIQSRVRHVPCVVVAA